MLTDEDPKTTLAVRGRRITKYFGDVVALDGVDLDVETGQIHGLVGPNGAGKTTLLGILLGLALADQGTLEVLGQPAGRALQVPDGVAGFIDGPGVYPSLTARRNLAELARLRGYGTKADIDDALAQVGLADVGGDKVRGFSLGMRQRIGLAAALLIRPRLLILDEPSNGLDPAGRKHVHGVLRRLAADGTAVLLSSHQMDDLEALCSEVTIVASGRVVFSGSLSKLADESRPVDYRLRTSDPATARHIGDKTPGVTVQPAPTANADQDLLVIRANIPAIDALLPKLLAAGAAVRELTPVISPLESAFLALGDVFSVEDRLGTWRHLLVAVRSPRRIFAAKALASLTVIAIGFPGLAVSATAGGIAASGLRPLTGMDGLQLTPGDALVRIALVWLCALAPTLALAAIGLLGSVSLGRSPMGLLIPAVVALGMQLAQDLPMDAALRLALPGYVFLSWNGLFETPEQPGMVLIGVAVSLAWAVTATVAAYLIFMRREFASSGHDGAGRRAMILGIAPLAGLFAVSAVALALAAPGATGSGIDEHKVETALATEFANLYPVQIGEIYHQAVSKSQLAVTAVCDRGGGLIPPEGPGNDWRCTVSWHVPDVSDATGQAIYQLDVNPNGRFVADGDGPKEVNGYFLVHAPYGDAPNPLWQFDGTVDLLATSTKG